MRGLKQNMRLTLSMLAISVMMGSVSYAQDSYDKPLLSVPEAQLIKTLKGGRTLNFWGPFPYFPRKTAKGKNENGSKIYISKKDLEEHGYYLDSNGNVRKMSGDAPSDSDVTVHSIDVYMEDNGNFEYRISVDGGSIGYNRMYSFEGFDDLDFHGSIGAGLKRPDAEKAFRDLLKQRGYRVDGKIIYDRNGKRYPRSLDELLNDYDSWSSGKTKPGNNRDRSSDRNIYNDSYNGGGGNFPRNRRGHDRSQNGENYYDSGSNDQGDAKHGRGRGGYRRGPSDRGGDSDSYSYNGGGRRGPGYPGGGSYYDYIKGIINGGGSGSENDGHGGGLRVQIGNPSNGAALDINGIINALNTTDPNRYANLINLLKSSNGQLTMADIDALIQALQSSPNAAQFANLISALQNIKNNAQGGVSANIQLPNNNNGGSVGIVMFPNMTAEQYLAVINGVGVPANSSGVGTLPTTGDANAILNALISIGGLNPEEAKRVMSSGTPGSSAWQIALIDALSKANSGKLDLGKLQNILNALQTNPNSGVVTPKIPGQNGTTDWSASITPVVVHWEAALGGDHLQVPGSKPGDYVYLQISPDGTKAYAEGNPGQILYNLVNGVWVPTDIAKSILSTLNNPGVAGGQPAYLALEGTTGSEIRTFRFAAPVLTSDPSASEKIGQYVKEAKNLLESK